MTPCIRSADTGPSFPCRRVFQDATRPNGVVLSIPRLIALVLPLFPVAGYWAVFQHINADKGISLVLLKHNLPAMLAGFAVDTNGYCCAALSGLARDKVRAAIQPLRFVRPKLCVYALRVTEGISAHGAA